VLRNLDPAGRGRSIGRAHSEGMPSAPPRELISQDFPQPLPNQHTSYLFFDTQIQFRQSGFQCTVCYNYSMTKLLEQAFAQLRELPDDLQNKAAVQLIQYVDEISSDEIATVAKGRRAFEGNDFVPLDQWRNDVGLHNN